MAVFASRPMPRKACAATRRLPRSLSKSHSVRAGTASFASDPMPPNADAAAFRTSQSSSLSNLVRVGTAVFAGGADPFQGYGSRFSNLPVLLPLANLWQSGRLLAPHSPGPEQRPASSYRHCR